MENYKIKDEHVIISINPKLYPLDVIYSASYVFIDRAYVVLDGNPETTITVSLKPKKPEDLQKLALEFNNELLNYAQYKSQSDKSTAIKHAIIQRALLTNEASKPNAEINDPENIAKPWSENESNNN